MFETCAKTFPNFPESGTAVNFEISSSEESKFVGSTTGISEFWSTIWWPIESALKEFLFPAESKTSSSKEISEGLNKFSAVAESVGLSYEYASAALATVTATTRQSADIVGNAFKTLFARIQGLNLGETLDDGTTVDK